LSLGSLDADGSEVVSFPLEQNDAVAVRFHLLHHCQRMRPDGQFIHGSLHVFGACRATPSKASASDVHVHHADFSSPEEGDGKIWLRISNERGGPGPLPVAREFYWIVKREPDDGCEYYYRDAEAERINRERIQAEEATKESGGHNAGPAD
ncbi:MAG: hypothetical protein WBF17_07260, partial [Phycisphaerae bacterium]